MSKPTKLAAFRKGSTRSGLSTKVLNEIRAILNPLVDLQVKPAGSGKFDWSDGNVILTLSRYFGQGSSASSQTFHPFKVYQAANIVDADDSWRTFQMRGGLVAHRSKTQYFPAGLSLYTNFQSLISVRADGTDGHYGESFDTPTDLNGATMTQIAVPSTGDQLISGYPVQFVLSDTLDDNNAIQASVYLKVLEDYTVETYVRMVSPIVADSTGRPREILPDQSSQYILIAEIRPNSGFNLSDGISVRQSVYGNMLGRFGHAQMTYRGNWDVDAITSEWFYPGDVIAKGDPSAFVSGDIMDTYVKIGQNCDQTADPAGDSDWVPISYHVP